MSVGFPSLSWWLWSGKKKDAKLQSSSSLNSTAGNLVELDALKFPAVGGSNLASDSRNARRKWRTRQEGMIDKEHNGVLVPTDGGEFSSDSDTDASDWSIGWSEPHAPGFLSEDEIDGGFGVLVRCYKDGSGANQECSKNNSDNNANIVPDCKKYMEQWLSTLQGS